MRHPEAPAFSPAGRGISISGLNAEKESRYSFTSLIWMIGCEFV